MPIVSDLVNRCNRLLHQEDGAPVRWPADELVQWLNDGYAAIVGVKPEANAVTAQVNLVTGVLQSIPEGAHALITAVRNTAESSTGAAVQAITRATLDRMARDWARHDASVSIDLVVPDADPKRFYVYPPAAQGAQIEIVYSITPEPHGAYSASKNDQLKLDITYMPALVDYVVYRALSKDADSAGNANRAQQHYAAFAAAVGGQAEGGAQ